MTEQRIQPTFVDFFAGSGLVTEAFSGYFNPLWANDICPKKADVYRANHGSGHFHLKSITDIHGASVPAAEVSWASFPCQDLSLAGNIGGIGGLRSGLVWQWLRILDEQPLRTPILVAENVVGLVSASRGLYYRQLHAALVERGYQVGAIMLDAVNWVPHSRPRIFVVAVAKPINVSPFAVSQPSWCHTKAIIEAADGLESWVWWKLPKPSQRKQSLVDLVDLEIPCYEESRSAKLLGLISKEHAREMDSYLPGTVRIFPAYRRTRNGKQVLELRFDEVAGCLRTPEGGSSRQFLVIKHADGSVGVRLLSAREAARLMGAPDAYKLPGTYNDAYKAMGDAVAVPVARFLARQLLLPLAKQTGMGKMANERVA
jgi:DNA (cytosine-5)-methyltransferase 1